jgi:arabinan endo-1,5-alpha-L-arabinosidase
MKQCKIMMLIFVVLVGVLVGCSPQTATTAPETVYQYKIVNKNSGLVLGISSSQITAGSVALQWNDNGTADHLWHFISAGNGYYKILNMHSGEILGVKDASTSAGAGVLQWADNGTDDHLWEFISNGNDAYQIRNKNSSLVLDVSGASASSGASIIQEVYTGASDQSWKLVSTGTAAYIGPGVVSGDVTVHDPSMIRTTSGMYYVFSTSLKKPFSGIEMYSSTNRIAFTNAGAAFKTLPTWINVYNSGDGSMWAPDVSYHNGMYWLYYAISSFGSNVSAIGLATSRTAAPGTWTDQGLVIASGAGLPYNAIDQKSIVAASGVGLSYNAIDPGLVVDASGNWWLSWGSWSTGIYMIQIDPATGKRLSSNITLYHLAARPGVSKGLEGAYIYRYGNYYYLFASIDVCCAADATYHIIVGRSTNVTGPYTDEGGLDMLSGGGTILLSVHGKIVGPGGQSVMTDTDGSLFVYHYYDGNHNGSPTLGLNRLAWSSSGWPDVKVRVRGAHH